MKPTAEQFAAVCYLVLMDHHGLGYGEAHPSYAGEKLYMLGAGYQAFGALDYQNQQKVRQHLEKWGYTFPEELNDYD